MFFLLAPMPTLLTVQCNLLNFRAVHSVLAFELICCNYILLNRWADHGLVMKKQAEVLGGYHRLTNVAMKIDQDC